MDTCKSFSAYVNCIAHGTSTGGKSLSGDTKVELRRWIKCELNKLRTGSVK
jgi:hypothetical protein